MTSWPTKLCCELCQLWARKGMTSLRDLLIHYNNCDMAPFLTALQKQCDIYKQAELPSEACNVHMAELVDIMTGLGPLAWYGNAVRPVGCMMRRHWACSKQSGMAMAWWPLAVRITTAGILRAKTSCSARACRRKPMPTA